MVDTSEAYSEKINMTDKTKIIIALALLMIGLYSISIASALTITSFSVSPDEVAPGKTADITLIIKNNGNNLIENVNANLDLTNVPFAPYNSGSSFNSDEIEDGKTKTANFEIIAFNDAKSGIYKIPVHVTYTENDIAKNVDSLISVMINSVPILDVQSEDGLFLKNQNNKITLKVINKGLGDVKFLSIGVDSSTGYNVVSQKDVYIGDVDSNDFQTADFNIFFKDNSLETVTLPVTLVYKDITNKEYLQNFDVQLKVYNQQQAQDLGLVAKNYSIYYTLIIIFIVLVFILYRSIRKRRRVPVE